MQTKEEIYTETIKHAQSIAVVRDTVLKTKIKIADATHEADLIRIIVATEIFLAENENGKKKFSNETLRKNELAKRMVKNADYQEMKKFIKVEEQKLAQHEIDLEYERNIIGINKAYLYSLSGAK